MLTYFRSIISLLSITYQALNAESNHELQLNLSSVFFIIGGLIALGSFIIGISSDTGVYYTAVLIGIIIIVIGIFISRKKRKTADSKKISSTDDLHVLDHKKTKLDTKKKIGIGMGIFFGTMIVFGIIASSTSLPVDEEGNILTQSIPLGEKYHPAHTRDTIVVGDIAYKVIDSYESRRVGDALTYTTADGVFLLVDLEIENTGKQSILLSNNYFKLIDSQGHEFVVDDVAWVDLKNTLHLKQLQPSLPIKGELVFDVPKSDMPVTYTLEISEIDGPSKKYILL